MAVVVPAHAPSEELRQAVTALAACDPPADELVVVVDGGDPAVERLVAPLVDRVLVREGRGGPAAARNDGAAVTTAEILYFVDSDVVVPRDAIRQLQEHFAARPHVDAVIGSYDDDPPAGGVASRYKNLLNHHVHQTAKRGAETFWGACGAVRRRAFERVDGFDERYTRPCIEDIELGYRMRAAGSRIEVLHTLQVTHLKRWTARGMVTADVRDRAVPWSELILDGHGFIDDLNVSRVQRLKVTIACATVVAALAGVAGVRPARPAAAVGLATSAALDARLLRFFADKGGRRFALGAGAWHWLSYLYSAAAFAFVVSRRVLTGPR